MMQTKFWKKRLELVFLYNLLLLDRGFPGSSLWKYGHLLTTKRVTSHEFGQHGLVIGMQPRFLQLAVYFQVRV